MGTEITVSLLTSIPHDPQNHDLSTEHGKFSCLMHDQKSAYLVNEEGPAIGDSVKNASCFDFSPDGVAEVFLILLQI